MLLVLAEADDETTKRFVDYAQSISIACEVAQDWDNVNVSMIAESDGSVTVDLRVGPKQTAVTAILNRSIPTLSRSTEEAQFRAEETLASWWSILACFPGPVVNRSSRHGFIPNIEILSLAASVPSLSLPPGLISTDRCTVGFGQVTNVHRLRDGKYLGRLAAESTVMEEHEVHVFAPFDPSRTMHILLAGDRVFDLSKCSGHVNPRFAQRLHPLVSELRRRHATFSLVILEQTMTELRILQANPFPRVQQYQHIEGDVCRALLEYLTS